MEKFTVPVLDYEGNRITLVKTELTEAIALKMLDKWIHRLHLEAWNIHFHWKCRARDMAVEDCSGCTSWTFSTHKAVIQMVDPVDYPCKDWEYDYEQTLVHELLHLKFANIDDEPDGLRHDLTHQLLNDIATALVDAERSCPGC